MLVLKRALKALFLFVPRSFGDEWGVFSGAKGECFDLELSKIIT